MKRAVTFFLIALVATSAAHATTYYVDFASGSDGNSGTSIESPWKHAPGDLDASGNARINLQPGDVVQFKGGTIYRGSLEIDGRRMTGSPGNPITYRGEGWGTGKAMLDGSAAIPGPWTPCPSAAACGGNQHWQNIYYTDAAPGTNFQAGFFEDDGFLWYAQDPNPPDPFTYDEYIHFRRIPLNDATISQTRTSITDPRYFTQPDPAYWNGASVLVWRIPNVVVIRAVTAYDPATHTILHEDLGGDVYTDRDTYYAVLNHLSLIDVPGEYVVDEATGRFYVWPRNSDSPALHSYSYRQKYKGIYAYYVKDMIFQGLRIEKFAIGIQVIDAGGGITPERVEIRNNEVRNLKSNDMYAIHVGGVDLTVENNQVIDGQRSVGIIGGGRNILIENNYVARTTRQGIWFMGARDSRIVGNTVVDIRGAHSNAISVYQYSRNITVANNTVLDSIRPFTFENTENLFVMNNVFISNGGSGYIFAGWGGMTGVVNIFNNIVLNSANDYAVYIDGCNSGNEVFLRNNILDGGGCGTRSHNIYTAYRGTFNPAPGEFMEADLDRIFLGPGTGDYSLRPGSPAIDSGTDLSAYFTTDHSGVSRPQGTGWDIGAYEFVGRRPGPPQNLRVGQ